MTSAITASISDFASELFDEVQVLSRIDHAPTYGGLERLGTMTTATTKITAEMTMKQSTMLIWIIRTRGMESFSNHCSTALKPH
jgi:hypothetical protein